MEFSHAARKVAEIKIDFLPLLRYDKVANYGCCESATILEFYKERGMYYGKN